MMAVQVHVTGVLRVPNSNVWRLQWTETERSTQPGGPVRTTAWEGYVTIRLAPPSTDALVAIALVIAAVRLVRGG